MSTMDLLQLAKACQSEEEAFHFFQKRRDLYGVSCPGCKSSEYYLMHLGRLQCKEWFILAFNRNGKSFVAT